MLDNVSLSTSGRYRCEVSGEAPSFQTVSDHGDMIVVGEFEFISEAAIYRVYDACFVCDILHKNVSWQLSGFYLYIYLSLV